jgi:hypothetical protein
MSENTAHDVVAVIATRFVITDFIVLLSFSFKVTIRSHLQLVTSVNLNWEHICLYICLSKLIIDKFELKNIVKEMLRPKNFTESSLHPLSTGLANVVLDGADPSFKEHIASALELDEAKRKGDAKDRPS